MKNNMHQQSGPTNGVLELMDRSRDEVGLLCGQYHALKHEFEKINSDKNELQKHYILHYEMSHALNMEMHKQIEVLKRLQKSCSQVLQYLPPEPQSQLSQALEASKQLTCQDLVNTFTGPMGSVPISLSGGGMHSLSSGPHSSMHMNNGPISYTPGGIPMNNTIGHPIGSNKDDRSESPISPGSGINQSSISRYSRNVKGEEAGISANCAISGTSQLQHCSRRGSKTKDGKNNSSEDTTSETEDEMTGHTSDIENESTEGMNDSPKTKVPHGSLTSPGPTDSVRGSSTGSMPSKYSHHHHHHYHHHQHPHHAGKFSGEYPVSSGNVTPYHGSAGGNGSSACMRMQGGMGNQYPYMMGPPLPTPPPHGTSALQPPHSDISNHQYHHPPSGPSSNPHLGSSSYMRGSHNSMRPGGSSYDSCMGPLPPSSSHTVAAVTNSSRIRIPPPSSSPFTTPMPHHSHHPRNSGSASNYHLNNMNTGGRSSCIIPEEINNTNGGSPPCGFGQNSSIRFNPIGVLPHGEVICAIAIDSSNRNIFTGGKGTVKVWETSAIGIPNIAPVVNLECYQDKYIRSCKLMPNGEGMVVGGESETLVLWDLNTGQQSLSMSIRSVIETSYTACYAVALGNDGKLCYSCINDGKIAIWDLTSRTLVREIAGHENGASCIDLINDGFSFWTGGLDQDIRFWDLRETRPLNEYHFDAQVFTISLSSTYDWLAAGLENSSIEVLHPKSNERFKMNYHESCVMSVKVAKSGRWMASTGKDSSVRVFRMPRRTQEVCFRESDLMLSCDISENERLLVAGSANKTAIVFQPNF